MREVVHVRYGLAKNLTVTVKETDETSVETMSIYIYKWNAGCNEVPLLYAVDDKMTNTPQHLGMGSPLNWGEMLSIVLYTTCDCNYDLSKAMREDKGEKWKVFIDVLSSAITKLAKKRR